MRVFACSDFHGMLHFYKSIKEVLEPEDRVFFLGDAGDRGPHPWETIKAVLNDPQFIYIKGNHEEMLVDALESFVEDGYADYQSSHLLHINGGDKTLEEAIADPDMPRYLQRLRVLRYYSDYINNQGQRIVLSHAGFTPWKDDFFEDGNMFKVPGFRDLIWDREHFFDEWNEEDCVDCYIVHGHTPIPYLLDDIDPCGKIQDIEPGALWYDNDRKCCIDCGAVFTGICTLINLDTWEEEIFCSDPYL